jgi:hypothetical protein
MLKYAYAEVAEWQTRRSQKPMRPKPREGSTPSLGTHPNLHRIAYCSLSILKIQ